VIRYGDIAEKKEELYNEEEQFKSNQAMFHARRDIWMKRRA
jgi:hypothetical protein